VTLKLPFTLLIFSLQYYLSEQYETLHVFVLIIYIMCISGDEMSKKV